MKYLMTLCVVLLLGCSSVSADQRVTIEWKAGNCKDYFKVYRATSTGWVEIAELTDTKLEIVVPKYDVRWRVSGICNSGDNKGEWWMRNGVWTGNNVDVSTKR